MDALAHIRPAPVFEGASVKSGGQEWLFHGNLRLVSPRSRTNGLINPGDYITDLIKGLYYFDPLIRPFFSCGGEVPLDSHENDRSKVEMDLNEEISARSPSSPPPTSPLSEIRACIELAKKRGSGMFRYKDVVVSLFFVS